MIVISKIQKFWTSTHVILNMIQLYKIFEPKIVIFSLSIN